MLMIPIFLFLVMARFFSGDRRVLLKVMILLISMNTSSFLGGSPVDWQEQFAKGTAAYESGSYAKAIELWEAIAESGEVSNGHLFYNLGNAYFRQGQLGEAVACFLGARALIPRDRDLQHNLQIVAQKVTGANLSGTREDSGTDLEKILGFFSIKERLLLAGLFGLAASVALTLRTWKGMSSWPSILIALIAAFFSFAFYFGWKLQGRWGAVIANDSPIHSGPSDPTPVVLTLNEGAAVFVTDEVGSWLKIEHSPGRSGWVEKSKIRIR